MTMTKKLDTIKRHAATVLAGLALAMASCSTFGGTGACETTCKWFCQLTQQSIDGSGALGPGGPSLSGALVDRMCTPATSDEGNETEGEL